MANKQDQKMSGKSFFIDTNMLHGLKREDQLSLDITQGTPYLQSPMDHHRRFLLKMAKKQQNQKTQG
jgi:hypothetical protein